MQVRKSSARLKARMYLVTESPEPPSNIGLEFRVGTSGCPQHIQNM